MLDRDSEIEELLGKIESLGGTVSSLQLDNETLKSDNETLKSDNEVLRFEINSLHVKIEELNGQLGLSSTNSSIPPSQDTIGNREKIIKSRKERRDEAKKKQVLLKEVVESRLELKATTSLQKMYQMR